MPPGQAVFRQGEHVIAGANQVDFDEVDASVQEITLLENIVHLPARTDFVDRTEEFDRRDDGPLPALSRISMCRKVWGSSCNLAGSGSAWDSSICAPRSLGSCVLRCLLA